MSPRQPLTTEPELLLLPARVALAAGVTPRTAPSAAGPTPLTAAPGVRITLAFRIDPAPDGTWLHEIARVLPAAVERVDRAAILTLGGRARDASSVLGVLEADASGRRAVARTVARALEAEGTERLIIWPGAIGPADTHALLETLTTLGTAITTRGNVSTSLLVPAADTATYPTAALATLVNSLVLRLDPQVPAADPGPPLSVEDLRRAIGVRASQIGSGRIAVLLPAHGYLWQRDSVPRAISYEEALIRAGEWHAPLIRDAASRMLFARHASLGTLWVPDATTIGYHVREARLMGVRRFGLVVGGGEDPAILETLQRGF